MDASTDMLVDLFEWEMYNKCWLDKEKNFRIITLGEQTIYKGSCQADNIYSNIEWRCLYLNDIFSVLSICMRLTQCYIVFNLSISIYLTKAACCHILYWTLLIMVNVVSVQCY